MQTIKLNLIPGSVLPVVNVSQYDVNRQFALSVYEGAASYSLSGKSVEIRGTKPDGNGFAYDATDGVVSVSGSTATISTTQQMTAVGGQTMAELRITQSGVILGTLNFVLMVEPSALSDDTPISDTDIPAIERDFEAALEEAQEAAETATTQADIATTKAGEAATSATNARNSATSAAGSATTAGNAATAATTKADEAATSATTASTAATSAAADSLEAEGWAVGEQGGTPVGPTSPYYQNNAAYYAAQAGQYAAGGLIFKGSVAFANIPMTGMVNGDMYNITDDFTTDSRFIEGAGVAVKAGADIAFVAGSVNKWDILALGGGSDDYSQLTNKPQINSHTLTGDQTAAALGLASDAAMTGASAGSAGAKGLVPAPAAGDQDKVLCGDGTWKTPSGSSDMTGATASTPGTHGLVPAPAAGDNTKFLRGDGTWAEAGGGGGGGFDYKAWLTAGDLNPMAYADLAAVLADEKAVRKLMTIHTAVDYLASWKTTDEDIVKILSNDICAKWITLRDYALDTLDKEYRSLMESLGKYYYGEWALMPQVPKMTSNTAPYGEASATNSGTNAPAWKAFNDSESSGWNSGKTTYDNDRVQYHFVSPMRISRIAVKFRDGSSRAITHTVKFVASNDGSTWVDISDNVITGAINQYKYVDVNTTQAYSYVGMVDLNSPSGHNENAGDGFKLQFYAWAPKGNVPIMTSNTAPYGTASAYQVFDGNNATTASGTDFNYKFVNPVCVKDFVVKDGSGNAITGGTLQASNDGSTWVTPVADTFYMAWNVHFGSSTTVGTVQFYGRELKVSVPTMTSNTAPYGLAFSSTVYQTRGPWKAFNGLTASDSDTYASSDSVGCYVGYKFTTATVVKQVTLIGGSSGNYYATKLKIQASNDNNTWDDLTSTLNYTTAGSLAVYDINNDTAYLYYRMYVLEVSNVGSGITVRELQFYGFDYSEYDWDADNPRHYLYDHGVELETINTSGTVTKGADALTLSAANAQATNTVNLTSYNLLRGAVGQHFSGTTQLIAATTATGSMNAGNAPYNEYLDISNVNASLATGAKMTSAGVCDVTEMWLE